MDEQASSGNLELMSGRLKNPISSDEVANPSRFQRKPMRIKKLNNSNVLEIGQLLVTFKGSKFYGNNAFSRLQRSLESRVLQFYRHR